MTSFPQVAVEVIGRRAGEWTNRLSSPCPSVRDGLEADIVDAYGQPEAGQVGGLEDPSWFAWSNVDDLIVSLASLPPGY